MRRLPGSMRARARISRVIALGALFLAVLLLPTGSFADHCNDYPTGPNPECKIQDARKGINETAERLLGEPSPWLRLGVVVDARPVTAAVILVRRGNPLATAATADSACQPDAGGYISYNSQSYQGSYSFYANNRCGVKMAFLRVFASLSVDGEGVDYVDPGAPNTYTIGDSSAGPCPFSCKGTWRLVVTWTMTLYDEYKWGYYETGPCHTEDPQTLVCNSTYGGTV